MAKKILIIENDIFLGDALEKRLKSVGYDVDLLRDGSLSLTRLRASQPDLVLLDVGVSGGNGYTILEEKLSDDKISRIPVIVISRSLEPEEIDRILTLGARDYLAKNGLNPEDVMKKVELQLKEPKKEKFEHIKDVAFASSLKNKKVLWVEDDAFLSEIISKKLSNQGCKLFHEIEGETALSTAKRELPDIIILDILLPEIDGFEILKRLKQDETTKKIPVLMLSNLGQQSDIEKAKNLGAERFLIKATVSLNEIVNEIKNVVRKGEKT